MGCSTPSSIRRGLPSRGATYISRGEDIEFWLDEHGHPDYVIIYDLDDFFPAQHDCFIETNPIVGITDADAQKAIEILNYKV
ncbi:MAG: hypothetical protein K2H21_05235 [Muribaculaceae bacterium]|nr:hypothetical protein [Muribaculaceae bacterium]